MGGGDLPGGSTSGSSEVFERAAELRYFSFWDPALNGSAVKTSLLRDSKGIIHFLQPDTLSAARETQQGNESTINQRKQEMI